MKSEIFNGITYYIGKSAKENWNLLDISKETNNEYIWFHLNSFASPYIIMYATLKELDNIDQSINSYLQFGAELCKQHSKFKFMKDIMIMYVPIKKLTNTEKIGEVYITGKSKLIKL